MSGGTGRRVFVPADAAAVSLGADTVAAAFAKLPDVMVIRTGSRGMMWMEPLVEVEQDGARVGYPNVSADHVADVLDGSATSIGPVERYPWIANQHRITFARVGVIDPRDVTDYETYGGFDALRTALQGTPADVIAAVTTSGLRGRGGAGFPTGRKWQTVADAAASDPSATPFIVANADEGDSGAFGDRMLMEGDPLSLVEGMALAGYAVGAHRGYIYIRSEYPAAIATVTAAVDAARHAGYLGPDIAGSGFDFDIEVRRGGGAYICGEESSLLNSLEGKRGEVRAKPPIAAIAGLFGQPTVANNVLTLATVPALIADKGQSYAALGVGRSRGTQVFTLGGDVNHGGAVEVPFGTSVGELIGTYGAGTYSGSPVTAAQIGGPLGAYLVPHEFDLSADYETLTDAGAMLGHGGIVVWGDSLDPLAMARFAMEFTALESCGKCTPCRVGAVRGVEVIDALKGADKKSGAVPIQLRTLSELTDAMTRGSLCALGGMTAAPIDSLRRHFPEAFGPPATPSDNHAKEH